MLKHLVLGGGLAFAAAIQPGPLQAFLVARAAATGWRRTLPACFSPLLSDGPIALVSLLLLNRLPPSFQLLLRAAGGLLLLYLAGVTLLQWRRLAGPVPAGSTSALALMTAFYGTMCLTLVGLVLRQARRASSHRRPRGAPIAISAVVLAGLGTYLLVSAVSALGSP